MGVEGIKVEAVVKGVVLGNDVVAHGLDWTSMWQDVLQYAT